MCLLNDVFMSKVERVESELRKLSQPELRQVREWLDDIIEASSQLAQTRIGLLF